jgi:arylsulfatase A-like enzyme
LRRALPRTGAALLAALLALACGGPEPPARVVMIVADTLRADRLPWHGGDPGTAPFLADLASRSIVFEETRTVSSWTAPATASIFTSTWPETHGVDTGMMVYLNQARRGTMLPINRIPDDLESIPELMASRGYTTFGVSANPNVSMKMGFDRGFDRFAVHVYDAENGHAEQLVDTVLAWRDEIEAAPRAFLYIQFMDPHEPYVWHVEGGGRKPGRIAPMRSFQAYDGEIAYMDAQVGRLFEAMGLEQAAVIFTADHGQEFGEHGSVGHGHKLYRELLSVPLFVHLPGETAGTVAKGRASTLDVLPTLRALVGAPPSEQDVGIALVENGRPIDVPSRDLFASRISRVPGHESEKRSILRKQIEVIVSQPRGKVELYELEKDPGQKHNMSQQRPAVVNLMRDALDDHRERVTRLVPTKAAPHEPTPEEIEALRNLGYVEPDS